MTNGMCDNPPKNKVPCLGWLFKIRKKGGFFGVLLDILVEKKMAWRIFPKIRENQKN